MIAALAYVREVNGQSADGMRIHGVNLSVGYEFDPRWFACGRSPLCKEVDKLVRSGVAVVVAAGNTGYGAVDPEFAGPATFGLGMTINDPGNAERAITVGSTHRDAPHAYGVSYFSSKGPTGDGRAKPDLVAPGERITSCAAGAKLAAVLAGEVADDTAVYVQQTGTSMAAPHVSGALAALMSVRREFIGSPDELKRIVVESATPLRRRPEFQGAGLLDLMRALQGPSARGMTHWTQHLLRLLIGVGQHNHLTSGRRGDGSVRCARPCNRHSLRPGDASPSSTARKNTTPPTATTTTNPTLHSRASSATPSSIPQTSSKPR